MHKAINRIALRLSVIIILVLSSGICLASGNSNGSTINQHTVMEKPDSSQVTKPFNPSDIFVFTLPDFNNLEIPTKTHAAVIGSTHGNSDGRLSNFITESDYIAEMVKIVHDAGWKYAAFFSSDCGDQGLPNQKDWAGLDIDGNAITYSMPTETPRVCNSFHYSGFKDYIVSLGKKAVDCGVDIICIDSWGFNYDMLWKNGDFSSNSLKGFREYLRSKYTAKQLISLGINKIDTFDYAVFIRKNYLTKYQNKEFGGIPLFKDFSDFQVVTCKKFWSDFIKEVRAYAGTKGQHVIFTTNAAENDISVGQHNFIGLSALDAVDGFISEFDFGIHPYKKMMPEYKLLRGLGKPAALIPNCGTSAELLSRPDLAELMKIYIAEAYSSGEFTYVPYANMIDGPDGWQYYSADMNKLYSYFDFIYNNKTYYDNVVSAAKTAVLYSYPSIRLGKDSISSFFGISNLLLDANKQYDVVYAGDNQWINDKLTLKELNPYELLILPNVTNMSDKQLDIILGYLNQGGSVLAFGDIGSSDEMNNLKKRSKLDALLSEGTHKYGMGKFVYVRNDFGTTYLKNKDGKTKQMAVDLIAKLSAENITVSNASNVVTTGYLNKQGSQIIHIINYNYDSKAQRFNQQNNLNLQVALNKELSGKELEVYYDTPDENGDKKLKYSLKGGSINIQLPNLKVYGVIYIGEKGSFVKKISLPAPTPAPTPKPAQTPTPTQTPAPAQTTTSAQTPTPIEIHGENLIQNPGFESGTLTPWNSKESDVTASNAQTGTFSIHISNYDTGVWQDVAVKPNTTYILAGWFKNTKSGDISSLCVKGYGGSAITQRVSSTSYSQAVVTFTTGPSNTTATICVWKNTGSGDSYADDISLTSGS